MVEKLVVLTDGEVITYRDVATALDLDTVHFQEVRSLREARREFEREYIRKALVANDWHMTRTAEQLGVERSYLWKIMRKYGIEKVR
ncbi:MAG: hypothetical protein GXO73_04615 [Calditrichaeota bacterium]|nr:hypothetical protein [Calditrichota bacterium]